MSSGTVFEPGASHAAIEAAAPRVMSPADLSRLQRRGMSPRQQKLDWLWSWYATTIYDAYMWDWNGRKNLDPIMRDHVVSAAFIPPGFYDGGQTNPLKLRRPDTPTGLAKLIVDRYTSLLFTHRSSPRIVSPGDPDTEDYVAALVEECKLWSHMDRARTYGGAMGSIAVGFKFVEGTPVIELHDPRFARAEFAVGGEHEVIRLEKRYVYSQEDFDAETGEWSTQAVWYRRVIDANSDTLYAPELVADGTEPNWKPLQVVTHGLGFCPVVWIQNLPSESSVDGTPDAHGCYDLIKAYDMMLSQANKGTLANLDPTLVLITNNPLTGLLKGSDNAIQLPVGSEGKYLEMTGAATTVALNLAKAYRDQVFELAEVVLTGSDEAKSQTATEVERKFAAMLSKSDRHRVQYGDRGALKLVRMMLKAVRKLNETPQFDETGALKIVGLNLPPKVTPAKDGKPPAFIPRKLGDESAQLMLRWPRYFTPSLLDAQLAVAAAVAAQAGQLLDKEHAAEYVAEYFNVEDVQGMLDKVLKEKHFCH